MKISSGSPSKQRMQLALLAVLLVTAATLIYNQLGGVTTEVVGGASNTPAATRATDPAAALPEALRLGALEPAPDMVQGDRDPFGFGVPPRAPAPPAPPRRVVTPPRPAPVTPAGPTSRPPIPVKFLGVAEDLSRPGKLVSLSVNGSVVLAREGDVVDGRYRLIKVGLESIVMSYLDGQGQQIIRQ